MSPADPETAASRRPLTVIRHLFGWPLAPKDIQLIPRSASELAIVRNSILWRKVWGGLHDYMEVSKKKHCQCPNRAELHTTMAQRAMLIHSTMLVGLCIVGKSPKHLYNKEIVHELLYSYCYMGIPLVAGRLTGTVWPSWMSSMQTSDRNKSDICSMRIPSPRRAVLAPRSSIARSRIPLNTWRPPENSARHHQEQRISSSVVYASVDHKHQWED